ncbi:hypothetical protein C5167_031239 [Papaver somniferum]|nr:hypothetical protein C5167_031239 [Papaver somniferum]
MIGDECCCAVKLRWSVVKEENIGRLRMVAGEMVVQRKHGFWYDAMIFEALSNIIDPNGADIGSINDFIEDRETYVVIAHQRHEVPSNFRRLLSSNLRRLVALDKLEKVQLLSHESKVQTYYKIKKDTTFGTKAQTPKPSQDSIFAGFALLMA